MQSGMLSEKNVFKKVERKNYWVCYLFILRSKRSSY